MLKPKLQKKKKRKEIEALILWPPDVKLTHWKRPWYWERLMIGGEGDNRGWDGWMASPTEWTWIWANSGGWRWTGKPGMLQSMGSKRVGHDLSDWKMATTVSWKYWFNSSSLRPSNSIFKNSCIDLNVQTSLGTHLLIAVYVAVCLRLEAAHKTAGASCSLSGFDSVGLGLGLRCYTSNRLTGDADFTGAPTTTGVVGGGTVVLTPACPLESTGDF